MGDSAYEAIKTRAERAKLEAEASKAALGAFLDFFSGRATLSIVLSPVGGWDIRFVRDLPGTGR